MAARYFPQRGLGTIAIACTFAESNE